MTDLEKFIEEKGQAALPELILATQKLEAEVELYTITTALKDLGISREEVRSAADDSDFLMACEMATCEEDMQDGLELARALFQHGVGFGRGLHDMVYRYLESFDEDEDEDGFEEDTADSVAMDAVDRARESD